MKNQFFDFYLLSLQFTKNLPTKKILFRNVQIYRKDGDCSKNYFLVREFFLATLSFLDMVDFDDVMHAKD